MKKWIVLGSVVLVLAACVFLAVANLNSWLNDNREMLAERAEAMAGRKVSFSEVGVSLWPTLAVRLSDLRVGDDPAFSDGNFVEAEIVDVGVKVLPLLSGQVEVSRVVLRSPQVTIIQAAKGRNMDSLVACRSRARSASSRSMPKPSSTTRIRRFPPDRMRTSIRLDPASRLFSISSLTTEPGRSTTSPAAIRFTVGSSRTRIRPKARSFRMGGTGSGAL